MFLDLNQIKAIEAKYAQTNELMSLAVKEIVDLVIKQAPKSAAILVCIGKGNNGADALNCALLLQKLGYKIDVFLSFNEVAPLVKPILAEILQYNASLINDIEILATKKYDLVIDGILGIGINQEISQDLTKVFEQINKLNALKIAIDTPSGLNPFSGKVMGIAIKVNLTITFIGNKIGLYTGEGLDYAGEVIYKSLIPLKAPMNPPIKFNELTDIAYQTLKRTKKNVSKGDFGTVAVLGGNQGMQGALYLAGLGALYSGAGKIFLYSLDATFKAIGSPYELMHKDYSKIFTDLNQIDVLALGVGFGIDEKAEQIFCEILKKYPISSPLIIDADGLNLLAKNEQLCSILTHFKQLVLTPHPGEAARLLKVQIKDIQNDRVAAIKEIAHKFNATVVLKGAGSLTIKNNIIRINTTGNPGLAVGGSGDLLTGLISSFIAQKMPIFDAVNFAVYLHGLAADNYASQIVGGFIGIIPSELAIEIRKQLNNFIKL